MAETYEKTQAPTPRRRAEARRRGQVARSVDLVSAAVLLAAIALMQWAGPALLGALRTFLSQSLSQSATPTNWSDVVGVGALLARALAWLLAGVMVVAIVANVLQFGFLFRWPHNEDALDIGKGFERVFSARSRTKVVIDTLKLLIVVLIGWSLIRQTADRIVGLQQLDAAKSLAAGMGLVFGVALRIGVLLLTLGVLDFTYQRWRHERDLRMTPREVKDELRQMEGSPETKRHRRQFSNSLVSSRSERAVATANVLITHENQLAIAIRYEDRSTSAPRIVAKGAGAAVAALRSAAVAAGVAIVEQEPLARTLDKLMTVGGEIPQRLYAAVAEVLAYAKATQQGGER